ncbi:MAG: hypothetical protein LKM38_18630 [Pseudomonas veronii]|nr:hypothetical protein [Pseudomonas veronii]
MSTDKTNQSWGGRFSEPVDAFVARFTASVTFDQRLYRHDHHGLDRPTPRCWPRSAC